MEAGAEFALTQPIFDVAMLERFIERTKDSRIPVIAGIMPLASAAAAEFFTNEIPGCPVPKSILDRMRTAGSPAAARAEGIRIAQELVRDIRGMVQGVQVRGPFEEYDTAIQVLNSPPVYSHA